MEEPLFDAFNADHDSSRDAPLESFGAFPPTARKMCTKSLLPGRIRAEPVNGIVGELPVSRGNKVFQVVTPAR